jgi:hypothetical protein
MKKFILAMRQFKTTPQILKPKLVWNPKELFLGSSPWLVTYVFSEKTIKNRGLEVVHG